MADSQQRPGLRERKKQATRAKLIDAAADLIDKQGYSKTTVEQIANAVDVSPRTVAHYFPSKEQLLLSMVDAYATAAGAEFATVPADLPPLQALLAANATLLDRIADQESLVDVRRLASLLRTMHVSPPLSPLSARMRCGSMVDEMAKRMGTHPGDRRVELIFAVWGAVVGAAWSGVSAMLSTGEVDARGLPGLLKQRLHDAVDELTVLSD
ncbi:MAG: TetR/AcrR family transcriptional regulator [Mycobacterium sp.]|nr:TetR/AcrR family transcriptional regulator [Mycobacterium sp.]